MSTAAVSQLRDGNLVRLARTREEDLAQLSINTFRTLSMDAGQQANSGHPGTPMAMAPVVYCLWQRFLRFDPNHPIWPNRDRFVLSIGHASMLLYAMLHLTGVKAVNPQYETLGDLSVTLEDIKCFRQLDSKCPGHPEYRWTSGIETTTGPLGKEWLRVWVWRSPHDGLPATISSGRTTKAQRKERQRTAHTSAREFSFRAGYD